MSKFFRDYLKFERKYVTALYIICWGIALLARLFLGPSPRFHDMISLLLIGGVLVIALYFIPIRR